MNNHLYNIHKVLYGFVRLITILSLPYLLLLIVFGWGNYTVIYWLAITGEWMWQFALPLFGICSIYFLLALVLFHNPTNAPARNDAARMVFMALFTGAVLFVTSAIGLWQTGPLGYREHVTSIQLNSYAYHLQFYSPDVFETYHERYELYECQLNLFCKVIYTVSKGDGIAPAVERIELISNPDANTVSVQINGAIAFTHGL